MGVNHHFSNIPADTPVESLELEFAETVEEKKA